MSKPGSRQLDRQGTIRGTTGTEAGRSPEKPPPPIFVRPNPSCGPGGYPHIKRTARGRPDMKKAKNGSFSTKMSKIPKCDIRAAKLALGIDNII
jgi:hypothetical protein